MLANLPAQKSFHFSPDSKRDGLLIDALTYTVYHLGHSMRVTSVAILATSDQRLLKRESTIEARKDKVTLSCTAAYPRGR